MNGEAILQSSADVGDGGVGDSRIGGEELVILRRADKDHLRIREALLGSVEEDTGDGDIGAEGDARENEDGPRIDCHCARDADATIARGVRAGDGLREEIGVDFAQRRLEAVGQTFGEDAEERVTASVL